MYVKVGCPDNKNINKHSLLWKTWTLNQSSNIARFSFPKLETSLVYIDHLDIYQFRKIINMFRVGIQPPENKENEV